MCVCVCRVYTGIYFKKKTHFLEMCLEEFYECQEKAEVTRLSLFELLTFQIQFQPSA
jgi:hypothetical protein